MLGLHFSILATRVRACLGAEKWSRYALWRPGVKPAKAACRAGLFANLSRHSSGVASSSGFLKATLRPDISTSGFSLQRDTVGRRTSIRRPFWVHCWGMSGGAGALEESVNRPLKTAFCPKTNSPTVSRCNENPIDEFRKLALPYWSQLATRCRADCCRSGKRAFRQMVKT